MAYFVPHQANFRISKKVAADLNLPIEKVLSNIQQQGNTGSACIAFSCLVEPPLVKSHKTLKALPRLSTALPIPIVLMTI
ncbi:MAG: 3-oxoacyl-[acyl-carrier-protein] synthase III C-terminal domain-containing protein [Bacteroidota bacterium]